jgi:hypothetical protein
MGGCLWQIVRQPADIGTSKWNPVKFKGFLFVLGKRATFVKKGCKVLFTFVGVY